MSGNYFCLACVVSMHAWKESVVTVSGEGSLPWRAVLCKLQSDAQRFLQEDMYHIHVHIRF